MALSNLVGSGGGLASAASGLLLLAGHLFNLGGDPQYGTVLGLFLVLTAHVALVFVLVALYAVQAERSGLLGSVGMVLSVVGTTLVSGVVLVEIAGASGVPVNAVLEAGFSGTLSLLAGLAFFVGLILFGIATMRAGVLPRWAGLVLVVGDVEFAMADFVGPLTPVVVILGALITCAALVWLGLGLLTGTGSDPSAGQPARVG